MSPNLTTRQCEVLDLLVKGLPNKEIAARLGISLQTTKWHVSRLLAAHGVDSRTSLVREVLESEFDALHPTLVLHGGPRGRRGGR